MDKIVFFDLEGWEKEYIQNLFGGNNVFFLEEPLDETTVTKAKDATIISAFLYSKLSKQTLSNMPKLKFIATRSTGFDHVDLSYCQGKNIVVSNVPAYGVDTIAEHTFALLLAITRKIIPSVERTRKGNFSLEGMTGMQLFGRTMGVIGAGNIGKRVIALAKAFGMHVLVFTKHPDKTQDPTVEHVSLKDLLHRSDIITLHVPLTDETKHILNRGNISLCKKGSILLNTARGGLIETQAIVEGLEKGIFAAVGLDVLEEEGFLHEERELLSEKFLQSTDLKTQLLNHVLLNMDNVIITPHNAFNSKEAVLEILEVTLTNIQAFIRHSPQNVVSKQQ